MARWLRRQITLETALQATNPSRRNYNRVDFHAALPCDQMQPFLESVQLCIEVFLMEKYQCLTTTKKYDLLMNRPMQGFIHCVQSELSTTLDLLKHIKFTNCSVLCVQPET